METWLVLLLNILTALGTVGSVFFMMRSDNKKKQTSETNRKLKDQKAMSDLENRIALLEQKIEIEAANQDEDVAEIKENIKEIFRLLKNN